MRFSKTEIGAIYKLAESITGSCQTGYQKKENLINNISRRMSELRMENLNKYLSYVLSEESERAHLISSLTIHLTSWFREAQHFTFLEQLAYDFLKKRNKDSEFLVWSSACSTGEEAYTIALVLSKIQRTHPTFKFRVIGTDIDPICIQKAKKALYKVAELTSIPVQFHEDILKGFGAAEGVFTISSELKAVCDFRCSNLIQQNESWPESCDVIFCRNVLIYFAEEKQSQILLDLSKALKPEGYVFLGLSDTFKSLDTFRSAAPGVLKRKTSTDLNLQDGAEKPRLLVVDDSATVRRVMYKIFSPMFEIEECESANAADELLSRNHFDIVALDLNMPGENGTSWLQRKRKENMTTPVVIVSDSKPQEAQKIFGALESGAQEYIVKERLSTEPEYLQRLFLTLSRQNLDIPQMAHFKLRTWARQMLNPEIILVGASTGGPEALVKLIKGFSKNTPPVVAVQHISSDFAMALSHRLAQASNLQLGDLSGPLCRGHFYLAQEDYHLKLKQSDQGILYLEKSLEERWKGHRPAVDVLFKSAAQTRVQGISILLTGMGEDGAQGMVELANQGQFLNIVQDQYSSVVFGMPRKALEKGAVHLVLPLSEIASTVEARLGKRKNQENLAS